MKKKLNYLTTNRYDVFDMFMFGMVIGTAQAKMNFLFIFWFAALTCYRLYKIKC
jgi:hypothetical protein